MKTETNGIRESAEHLTEDARALLAATADAAGEKVAEARNRLSSALSAVGDTYADVRKKAIKSAKAADKVIHEKPYHAIGVAFGLGALVGYLISRRNK